MTMFGPSGGEMFRGDRKRRFNVADALASVERDVHDFYTGGRAFGIREGREYRMFRSFALATGASKWVTGVSPNPWSVVSRIISVDRRGIRVRIHEGPFDTITPGTIIGEMFNSNRLMADESMVEMREDATSITGGTVIDEFRVPGAAEQGNRRDSTQTSSVEAWVYAPERIYAIQFTNTQSTGDPTNVQVNWAILEAANAGG